MIKINCECKEFLSIDELTEFQGELKHREQSDVEKIIKSIKKHGFCFPFFVWKHDGINHVFDGHGRLLALKYLKSKGEDIPALPVVYVNAKDEAEAKELLLKLNSNYGHMTQESVLEFLDGIEIDLSDIQLPDTTMSFDMDDESEETENDDEVPEVQEDAVSQPGEMYELGNSILMCGDSTKEEDWEHLMCGEKANMVFTDPPYNVAIGDKNKALQSFQKAGWIVRNLEGDANQTDEEVGHNLWLPAFRNLLAHANDDCALYVTMPQGGTHMMMMMMIEESGWQVKHELIWIKNCPTFSMGRLDYDYQHEPILYGWNKSHVWYGKGKFNKSIWNIDKPKKCNLHPTMKPIELIENAILNSSKKGDLILDAFGGSGSTLLACEKNGRRCRMIEHDPIYCDVIRRRYTQWAKENGRPITSGCLE